MFRLAIEIFKAVVKSQSRFYWSMFLLCVTTQIAAFTFILPFGFWYALAVASILQWLWIPALNRWFNWEGYVSALFVPDELRVSRGRK
jgi:hypothetical protein